MQTNETRMFWRIEEKESCHAISTKSPYSPICDRSRLLVSKELTDRRIIRIALTFLESISPRHYFGPDFNYDRIKGN
ncbi:hypothetical protein BH18THE2_BH18THE2_11620 [soil metagenome]